VPPPGNRVVPPIILPRKWVRALLEQLQTSWFWMRDNALRGSAATGDGEGGAGENMVIDGQPCEEKLPESPKSPMSLPASMELSPTKSPLKSPPASPLPMGLGLLEAGKEPTTAELLKRAAAQRKAEAPGAPPPPFPSGSLGVD